MTFVKGQSGNPSGRPTIPSEVRELARAASVDAIKLHIAVMNDPDEPTPVRQKSADTIMDRAWGKPAQPVDGDGEGGAIKQLVEIRFVRPGEN
jgi:hypothetical protein